MSKATITFGTQRVGAVVSCVVAAVALAGLLSGCIETDPAELELGWTFPELQDCEAAGVAEVEVEVSASTAAVARFPCGEGLAPRAVHLGAFEPGLVVVRVSALDPEGVVSYVGEGRSPIDEGSQSIVLALEAVAVEDH